MSRPQPATSDRDRGTGRLGDGAVIAPRHGVASPATRRQQHLLTLSIDRPARGVVVVTIHGEIDLASVPRLTELIRQRMTAANLRAVVLDLSAVQFVNSFGIELLVHAQSRAEQRGIDLRLVLGDGPMRRLLALTRLTDRFTHHGTVDEALARVG
ncbi:anti-sigma factor antagonist [Allosaccharopolyspora coralli]|uniref:Anti-sigma factor antagonist n=1 Tax=Allosaccharopolyspora coralli TaxID=2665642 RepID=A0A5Q3Q5M0_9PSEU|nr:STAS domain-containing protein [Allosaccharopolyspora coralli]QGK69921.1 anti-sigma factor antagonist [Allosaccharopolyspora coralli]